MASILNINRLVSKRQDRFATSLRYAYLPLFALQKDQLKECDKARLKILQDAGKKNKTIATQRAKIKEGEFPSHGHISLTAWIPPKISFQSA